MIKSWKQQENPMKYIKYILIAIITVFSTAIHAEHDFSKEQVRNLQKAYNYGKNNPLKFKGTDLNYGYIMAAIMWQESSAGTNIGAGRHAVGPYQNLVTTVQSRMKQNGINKSRSQISKELASHATSAKWSRIELSYWLEVHNGSINKALASYNAGWKYQKGLRYSNSVIRKAKYLKQHKVLMV